MNKIKDKNKIKVFYNDSCPVCKREIEIYKSRSEGVEYNDSSEMDDKFTIARGLLIRLESSLL